jgi:ParB family chromosome partitioning protein
MLELLEHEIQQVPLVDLDIFVGQSRESFDEAELDALADSLKEVGQLQPGVAWFDEARERLILICGECRLRALKKIGAPTMAVKVIRGKLTQSQMLSMNFAENVMRANLNPLERAKAFRRLMQLEDITASEVALRLHVSNAMVSRDLAILELSPELQQRVASGVLPSSVAASLARLGDDDARRFLAEQFGTGNLSRDEVTVEVNKQLNKPSRARPVRVAGKHEGVTFSFAFAAGQATPDALLKAIESIRLKLRELQKAEHKDVSALADMLRAS